MTVIRHAQRQHSAKRVNAVNSTLIFTGPTARVIDYLVVASGGSGAGYGSSVGGGGAGGGGLLAGNVIGNQSVVFTITVGASSAGVGSNLSGVKGSNSSISSSALTAIAIGGGNGSFWIGDGPGNGGSGGGTTGASQGASAMIAGKGIYPGSTFVDGPRQGYDGALGTGQLGGTGCSGGGGGGATAAGSGSSGGAGYTSSISGTSTTYSSGGSGSAGGFGSSDVSATFGGGGRGATSSYSEGGGPGIVILRYPDSFPAASNTTGSPNVTVSGGYRIYKFTSSGTITF